nr:MAG: protein of unknown function DUF4373 [Bacteriophage sp.]
MKDTFYFQHDYNARSDPKLQEVLIEHGAMGLGVFWCIVEQLYEQGGCLPLKLCKSIAFALHVESTVVESIVHDFGLFQNDGEMFWSNSVKSRLDKRKTISETRKLAAIKRWKSVQNIQEQSNSNANALQDISKGKEIKGKEIDNKENIKEKSGHRFSPPTIEEIRLYILEKGYSFDAERFFDFYESKGWFVGKNKMKDWKAAIRNWAKGEKERRSAYSGNKTTTKVNDEWK